MDLYSRESPKRESRRETFNDQPLAGAAKALM